MVHEFLGLNSLQPDMHLPRIEKVYLSAHVLKDRQANSRCRMLSRQLEHQDHLDIGVHNQLGQPQDLTAQVEGVPKARLLALLGPSASSPASG